MTTPQPTPDLPPTPPPDSPGLPHRPAGDEEEVYFDGPPSVISHLGEVVLFSLGGVVVLGTPFLIRAVNPNVPWWAYPVAVLLGVGLMAVPWVKIRSLRYRISNYRIDYERGMLWKRIDTLELWHVEDISFAQSPVDRVLGLGTITITSHDETNPHLVLRGLANAREIFEALKQRIIAVKRQRGVIKMDVG